MSNKISRNQIDLDLANMTMGNLYEQIRLLSLPPFGSDMLYSNSCVASITVASRVLKKYERPNESRTEALRAKCYADWVAYEDRLRAYDFYKSMDTHPIGRGVVYKARLLLHTWFKGFRIRFKDLELPSGSTFEAPHRPGAVSIIEKLSFKKYWTVTHDACDDFIRLCYNTLWLKRSAKAFFKKLSKKELAELYWEHSNAPHVGYAIFSSRMRDEVLTLVMGSRGSSVYKNCDERRFINIEPLGNMILQRAVALGIRSKLRQLGNDLQIGQDIHKQRISDRTVSTIDFSKASDSVIKSVVEFMFPQCITKYLMRYRSEFCLIDGDYYPVEKLSSMGNGFTFEVMTSLLLAVGRVLDETATVYGDDVIIHNYVADHFVDAAESLGFMVNAKKTFLNSSFRESCGGFYSDQVVGGYIVSYDFHFIENDADYITTCNKLYRIIKADQVSASLMRLLLQAYDGLLALCPTLFKGPAVPLNYDLPSWVQTDNYRRKHMRDPVHHRVYRDVVEKINSEQGFTYINKHYRELDYVRQFYKDWVLICVPMFVANLNSKTPHWGTKQVGRLAAYFYAGQIVDDTLQHKGQWSSKMYLVSPWGTAVKVSDLTHP